VLERVLAEAQPRQVPERSGQQRQVPERLEPERAQEPARA
jgi:hypothetical protein